MDFIEAFPKMGEKLVVLTIVYRFSMYAHFIPLGHPYSAALVARVFFDGIVGLHGFPCSIISDRDTVFTSTFWRELFHLAGIKLNMSLAFHSQSDGQSEVVNRVITMYLWCLASDRSTLLAAVATLDGILLQHFVPDYHLVFAVPGGVWSRPAGTHLVPARCGEGGGSGQTTSRG